MATGERFRLYLVPHTHFDAEVFLTREDTLALASDNLLDVLHLLDVDPEYRYTLDQRAYLEGFARKFPEEMPRVRAHVASGRLELAGGMHVMPDANLPSGESLVRQLVYGRAYLHGELGSTSTIGWMLDSFGHHPQMPQIMRKAGFDTYVFQRGVEADGPASFRWVGLDGTSIRAEWLPLTYASIGVTPTQLPGFANMIEQVLDAAAPYARDGRYLVLGGLDLSAPEHHLPELARRYNESQDRVELVIANASEYFRDDRADDLSELRGDLNPIFTGCYTSRIALKQLNRRAESTLATAEKLGAILRAETGAEPASLEAAWEPVLFNQFHDLICGSHLDEPYRLAVKRYEGALELTDRAVDDALAALGRRVDASAGGVPLLVFNPLPFARRDVARCRVSLTGERLERVALVDAAGAPQPVQLDDVVRHPDGTIKRADVVFVADAPALGYATYFLRAADGVAAPATGLRFEAVGPRQDVFYIGLRRPDDGVLSNEILDVRVNLRTGAIRSLVLRETGWDVVDPGSPYGFGTIARQEDRGDPWEYYGPLRAGVTARIPLEDDLPARGRDLFSDEYGAQPKVWGGPVCATVELKGPFGTASLVRRFRLYAGLPRLELETEIVNQERFVRYRALLPLTLAEPRIAYEIPFGAIERPPGEFPAQTWVDVGDGERGVALLNRGTPGHSLVGSTLSASLLKCTRVTSYESVGGYDPRAADELGFEVGVVRRFEHALLPHAGDWRAAGLVRAGAAYNAPLLVRALEPHGGPLPPSRSFVEVRPENVALHALHVRGDELVLRVSETAGARADGEVRLAWPVVGIRETDLAGAEGDPVAAGGDRFSFSLDPWEIRTYAIRLG